MTDKFIKRGLGRGLSALMADVNVSQQDAAPRRADLLVALDKVFANPDQPRRNFDPAALDDLARSIREKGVIQPLIVRPRPGHDGEYQIVAGERRWRAAQMAQLHDLPVLVRDLDDTEVLELAIIENIQRADLNPIEEAAGFLQLMDRFGHTQEKLAEALGKSRSHIANLLRLLTLPDEVIGYVRDGRLSAGHARTLVTSDDAVGVARRIIKDGLSVRAAERLAKRPTPPLIAGDPPPRPRKLIEKDADTRALEQDLSACLSMAVDIAHDANMESGHISIRYATLDELDELCRMLTVRR